MPISRGLALALLLALAAPVLAQDETRVITLRHRTAAETIPLVQPLLGPNDAVTGTDYRLIVRSSPKRLKEIEQLLTQIDTAPARLRITVRQVLARDAARLTGQLSADRRVGEHGRVVTSPAAPPDERGLTIERRDEAGSVRYQTRRTTSQSADTRTQVLRATEGRPAYIRIGQSVPHIKKILSLRHGQATVAQGVEYQNVTSGFQVTARLRDGEAQLDVVPHLASLQDPALGLADFRALATQATVKLGEWTDLGGVLAQHDAVSNAILEGTTDEASDRWTILVLVEKEG